MSALQLVFIVYACIHRLLGGFLCLVPLHYELDYLSVKYSLSESLKIEAWLLSTNQVPTSHYNPLCILLFTDFSTQIYFDLIIFATFC